MDSTQSRSVIPVALAAVTAAAFIYKLVSSLILHPLAKIPGPKYAAVSRIYQIYYDVIKRGRFPWEIKRLHEVYGPVVRIGPNEVHVAVPDFYDELFTSIARPRDRDDWEVRGFGLPDAVLNSPKFETHRMRRAALNPYFSAQAIGRVEPVVRAKIEVLCGRLHEALEAQQPFPFETAFMALTTDIITEYCFSQSYDLIKQPDLGQDWYTAMVASAEASMLGRYIPSLTLFMKALPESVVGAMMPPMLSLLRFTKDQEAQAKAVKHGQGLQDVKPGQRTIIHSLFESDLPESEKSVDRVAQEAQTLVAAGAVTTSFYLKSVVYYILSNPSILHRLQAELDEAITNTSEIPPLNKLQRIPYLGAIVKEGGRVVPGALTRLGRIAPHEDLKCGQHVFPAGTVISMSTWIQHNDPSLFPEPQVFNPDRWLDQKAKDGKLERYLVPYSKGSRGCLGINLAQAEIYFTLATLFRRFDMELFETDFSDVELAHEFFVPASRLDSKGCKGKGSGRQKMMG